MKKIILVTGGAGFIGSHVVDALIADGYKVAVVDDLSTGLKKNVNPKADFYKVDIVNKKSLSRIFDKYKFWGVIHHAAQINVRKSVDDPAGDAKTNIIGSINLLDLAAKYKVKRIIFASTGGAMYGNTKTLPTPDNHIEEPLSPYGVAKLAIEKYLYYFMDQHGLSYAALRYANVYGPRQNPHGEAGVVSIFIEKLLAGQTVTINGDGKQTRDYVYVADVAKANLLALKSTKTGSFNIGTGKQSSVNQIYKLIAKQISPNKKARYGKAKVGEQKKSALNSSRASKELKWKPEYALTRGIKETVDWFKENN